MILAQAKKTCLFFVSTILCSVALEPTAAFAAAIDIPGPADIGKIKPEEKLPGNTRVPDYQMNFPTSAPVTPAPEGAAKIRFVLKQVIVEGATVFSAEELSQFSAPHIGKEISLDVVYKIAEQITAHYRDEGYFLSLTYVPEQSIDEGIVKLKVVEGYVGSVKINGDNANSYVVRDYIERLKSQKPLKSDAMESFLLRLNDLPGHSYSGVLSSLDGADEGAVQLTLVTEEKQHTASISFDNFSSRFLGPNQFTGSYSDSFIPLHQTSLTAVNSAPTDRLTYGAVNHSVVVAPDIIFDVTGAYTKANPAFTLEPFEIESNSTFLATSLSYQAIRQRQENLALKLSFDSRTSKTDFLETPLTRDRIRTVRANATFDIVDNWMGYNIASLTLSKGIDGFGSSQAGDLDISRAEAKPNFKKAELALTRLQNITDDWSLLLTAQGQLANGPLFSSEEFGYGGQAFGRAFDSSEISGDHGIAGSVELRYGGWGDMEPLSVMPYVFYDIGQVWNEDVAQIDKESGSSAGLGLRLLTDIGLSANFGLAWPLTRPVATPIYGQGDENPRILLQVSQSF